MTGAPELAIDAARGVHADALWFGPTSAPLIGWLSTAGGVGSSGVLILPPVGYGYLCSHRALRVLAERLAEQGHAVLRIDYHGTGDSSGDQGDPDRLGSWQESVRLAVRRLRELGCKRLTVIGARLGATLALLEGPELDPDAIVAWAPVTSGSRFVKELRLLAAADELDSPPLGPGAIVTTGSLFTGETLDCLEQLSVADLHAAPARRLLYVDEMTARTRRTLDRMRELGCAVDQIGDKDSGRVLVTPPELGDVPVAIIAEICRWVGDGAPASAPVALPPARARFAWKGREISEEIVQLGPHRHVGVVCALPDADAEAPILVLLNPGSETHVGPGRAWVELARNLALDGHRSIRVDFRGWGESPDEGLAPGRPYDQTSIEDTIAIAEALRALGHRRVVLFGLCASAWIALAAARRHHFDGVIALNPQLYWRPGDPAEIDWDLIRARRAKEIASIARGDRIGLWSLLDRCGLRPPAATWLGELERTGAPVALLFSEGDDGLVYLRQRLGRGLSRLQRSGVIELHELADIDHPMHRIWLRDRVLDAVAAQLQRIDATEPKATAS